MQSINYFKNDNSKEDYTMILEFVKGALKDAKLLDQITIEERKEGFMVKPKTLNKQEKIMKFEHLAGSAIPSGEDVRELIDIANRKEEWRGKEVE